MSLALYTVHTVNSENFLWSMRTFYTLCTEELAEKLCVEWKKNHAQKKQKSAKHAPKKQKSTNHAPKKQKSAKHAQKEKKRETRDKRDKKWATKRKCLVARGGGNGQIFVCVFFTSHIQNLHTCLAIFQVSQDDLTRVMASKKWSARHTS